MAASVHAAGSHSSGSAHSQSSVGPRPPVPNSLSDHEAVLLSFYLVTMAGHCHVLRVAHMQTTSHGHTSVVRRHAFPPRHLP
jgi:hypothetical protein